MLHRVFSLSLCILPSSFLLEFYVNAMLCTYQKKKKKKTVMLCVWKLDIQVSVLLFRTYLRQTVDKLFS